MQTIYCWKYIVLRFLLEKLRKNWHEPAQRKPWALICSQTQNEGPSVSAWFFTEPGQAQPEEPTRPLLHPAGPPPTGRTTGAGCAAKRVAVKAEGNNGLDPGSILGRQHHLAEGEQARACVGEHYQLGLGGAHIVGLTSDSTGTKLLDRGWTQKGPGCEASGRCGDTHQLPAEWHYGGVYPSRREGRLPML